MTTDEPETEDLGALRLAAVRRHMKAENDQDFDAVIATFARPRYELMASGKVHDGEEAVRSYFATSRGVIPDQRNENTVLRLAEDVVVAEFDLMGTLDGTGRSFSQRMVALFEFEDGGDGIVCERVYYDRGAIRAQLAAPD